MPAPARKHFEKYECKAQTFSVSADQERPYAKLLSSHSYIHGEKMAV